MWYRSSLSDVGDYVEGLEIVRNHARFLAEAILSSPTNHAELQDMAEQLQERIRMSGLNVPE